MSPWILTAVAVYCVVGYFSGNEFSATAGMILTSLGFATGLIISKKFEDSGIAIKLAVLGVPLLLLAFILNQTSSKTNHTAANFLTKLNGVWRAENKGEVFTVDIKDSTALLSVEPGLKNVKYRMTTRNDTLILSAYDDDDNRMLMDITRTKNNQLALDAGSGLVFRRAK